MTDAHRAPRLLPGHYTGRIARRHAAQDLRLVEVSYEHRHRARRHAHENGMLCVVLEAACEDRYADKTRRRAPGDVFYVPHGTEHAQLYDHAGLWLIAEIDAAVERDWGLPREAGGPRDLRGAPVVVAARRLVDELRAPDDLSALAVNSLVLGMFADGLRREEREPGAWLDTLESALLDRIDRTPSLAELGRLVDRHPAHVSRAFRARHGCSVGEFLRVARVRAAGHLLRESSLSLAEIAARTGFADQSHMCRLFRRVHGTTPSRFRRRHGSPRAARRRPRPS